MEKLTLNVPEMSCGHCVAAVSGAVEQVAGVSAVDVDLASKRVEVTGEGLERNTVAAAVREAGYEPEES
ncbi:MAG TPA: heavy-metal-associated domain-containing protein [Solirubrobacterales bacterium]|nr:heavy-metal-associated domain-containing protein [Solirubrobacterales bacterium]